MKSLLTASAGALALMAGAGIAMAQDSATTGTQQMTSNITCAQIVTLDPDEAERALYFMAGYQAAQDSGMGTPSDTTAGVQTPTTNGATGTDTTASAETATGDTMPDTDTTASADTGTGTTADTDTTASAETAPGDAMPDTDTTASAESSDTMGDTAEGADTTTTAGTTASDGGTASDMLGGSGFFEIPVESVMTACEDAPDSAVSDILGQQRGGGTAQ